MAEGRGVVYWYHGLHFAARAIVSWWSLRQHWTGPVTVFTDDDESQKMAERAGRDLNLDVQRIKIDRVRRHADYLIKTMIPAWTPYKETVFLDADTVVVGKFEELFGHPLALTSFADWQSQGRKISGRIKGWEGKSPAIDVMVRKQLATSYPAINTGVFGFQKDNSDLATWHEITKLGAGLHMTDELAMQLLHTEIPHKMFDDRWNLSPFHGVNTMDVRIWHLHGRKHARVGKDPGSAVWMPFFDRCCEENPGGIADWAGNHDKYLRGWLRQHRGK